MKLTTKLLRKLIREAMNESSWDDRDNWPSEFDQRQARIQRMRDDEGEPDEPSTWSRPSQPPAPRRWAKRRDWPAWDKRAGWRGYEPAPEGILNVPVGHFEMDESGNLIVGSSGTMNTVNSSEASPGFLEKIKRGISGVEGYDSLVGHQFLKSTLAQQAENITKYLGLEQPLTAEQVHDAIKSVIRIKSW